MRVTLSPGEVEAIHQKLENLEKLLKHKVPLTDDPVLTTEQALNYLSISRRSLQTWRDEGKIEYSVINGKFYYKISSINKMLDKHTVKMQD